MPAFVPLGRYKITYLDGRTEEVRSNFAGIMELEADKPEEDVPYGTALAYGIWIFLGRPGDDVKDWAVDVYKIEPVDDDKPAPDPTVPVVGVA
jgi:hypothetical protein